jgi:MFS family permease
MKFHPIAPLRGKRCTENADGMKAALLVLHIAALMMAIIAAGAATVLLLVLHQLSGFATASTPLLLPMVVITSIGVVTTFFAVIAAVRFRLISAIVAWMGSLFLAPLLCGGLLGRWDWEAGIFIILGLVSIIVGLVNVLAQASALDSSAMKVPTKVH